MSTQCLLCVWIVSFWSEWQLSWQRVTVLSMRAGNQGCFCSHHTLRRIRSVDFMDGSEDGIGVIFFLDFALFCMPDQCIEVHVSIPKAWPLKLYRLKDENCCVCWTSGDAGDQSLSTILVSVVCLRLSNWLLFSFCKKCFVNYSKCGSLLYTARVPRADRFMFCARGALG